MIIARSGWGRVGVTTLIVLGVAWVSIHIFVVLVFAGLYGIFFPLILSAVPYFAGTWALARGPSRYGAVLAIIGAFLMIGSDVYVAVIFPAHPQGYPAVQMFRVVGKLFGWHYTIVPRPTAPPTPR